MTKSVLVIRKDLKLSFGKLSAQIFHSASRSGVEMDYENERHTCIAKYCKSEAKILNLYEQCKEQGVAHGLQIDAGHSEVPEGTPTVLLVGPDDPEKVDAITRKLQLLKVEISW
jgi:PTH2 family peptidyl-tRNA hydrolase